MTEPKLIVPIHKEEMIVPAKAEGADIFYVDFKRFIKNNRFSKPELIRFIKLAHGVDAPIYLHFGHNILEEDLPIIKSSVDQLSTLSIDGIMVNDFSVMEIIKKKKHKQIKYNIHLDSGLNIHNIASYDLLKKWRAKSVNITEEIYLKNVTRIKKYTGKDICINVNEVLWLVHYAVNWGVELFKISGAYEDLSRICILISLLKELITDVRKNKAFDNIKIEQILNLLDHTKPQKHYQTDHFTKKFKDYSGNDFEFTGNIKLFNWDESKIALPEEAIDYSKLKKEAPKLRLRLTSLNQMDAVEEFINKTGTDIIDIIEYGDIINPSDLAKHSYTNIIYKVKQYCKRLNIKLYLTTPNILIERDFERVVDTLKYLCFKDPRPEGLVVNNLGLWKTISNSRKLKELNIELGYGLNILNSVASVLFESTCPVSGINIPDQLNINQIQDMTENLNVKDKSLVILGVSKLDSSGLCPMNSDLAIISRLQCKAPCQKASYAVVDPFTTEMLPMVLDGFCRFHLIHSYIEDRLTDFRRYQNAGITDFIIDFSSLPPEMVQSLLERYCYVLHNPDKYTPIKENVILYKPKTLSIEPAT